MVVLLTLTLFGGNVIVAAHQTVLDPGYVTDTVDETDGYAALHAELTGEGTLPVGDTGSLPPFASGLAGEILTPEYLQTQTERNVENLYAYLHGNDDRLRLVADTGPLVNGTERAVAGAVRNTSASELAAFAGVESTAAGGVELETETLLRVGEDRETFRSTRGTVRERVRERLAEAGSEPSEREVNETLLALRGELRDRYGTVDTGLGESVDTAAGEYVVVYVDGLLTPSAEYDRFAQRLETRKGALADAVGAAAADRVDEALPRRLVVTDYLPAEGRRSFVRARAAFVFLDVLGWLLPLLALALAGQIWVVSEQPETPVLWTGVAALLAAAPGFLLGRVADGAVRDAVTEALPETGATLGETVVAFVGGFFGTLAAQSLALLLVGVLATGLGAAVRLDLVDVPDRLRGR